MLLCKFKREKIERKNAVNSGHLSMSAQRRSAQNGDITYIQKDRKTLMVQRVEPQGNHSRVHCVELTTWSTSA